jgi:hypothetical protein
MPYLIPISYLNASFWSFLAPWLATQLVNILPNNELSALWNNLIGPAVRPTTPQARGFSEKHARTGPRMAMAMAIGESLV